MPHPNTMHQGNVLKKPVMVGVPPKRRLRIGLVAKSFIKHGNELFFDYDIKDKNFSWLKSDAKKIGTTFDQGKLMDSY